MSTYRTEVLTSTESFSELRREWTDLLAQSSSNTIYMSCEWIDAWLNASVEAVRPFIVTARDSKGALAGIAAYYRTTMTLFGSMPLRVLRPMGDVNSGSEYPDWIVDESHRDLISQTLADTLREHSRQWDLIWMPRIAPGAGDSLFSSCNAAGLKAVRREKVFSGMSLPDSIAGFEAELSSNSRSRIRRLRRRFAKREGIEFLRCESEADLAGFLDALFDLHQRRWLTVGRDGVFVRKPRERAFYESFAPVALARSWLGLYALRQDGEYRAVQIGYSYNGVFSQLQEGFDPDIDAGAGNVLRDLVISDLIERGIRYYDFLGGWSEHKRRWGAKQVMGSDILVGSTGLRGRSVLSVPIWPSGRFIAD